MLTCGCPHMAVFILQSSDSMRGFALPGLAQDEAFLHEIWLITAWPTGAIEAVLLLLWRVSCVWSYEAFRTNACLIGTAGNL